MKNTFTKLCAALLTLTLVLSAVSLLPSSAKNVTDTIEPSQLTFSEDVPFVKVEDDNGIHFYGPTGDIRPDKLNDYTQVIESVQDYYEITATQAEGKTNLAPVGNSISLPTSADNSQNVYFPAVGDQKGLGACGTFAAGYYQLTYEINRDRNIVTTPENTFSPKWIYNLTNGGNDNGTMLETVYMLLEDYGCAPLSLVPYNDEEFNNWHTDEGIWREASKYRLESYQTFDDIGVSSEGTQITSPDDEDLMPIKTALANGDVLTYSSFIYSWDMVNLKTHPNAPENNKFKNEYVMKGLSGTKGSHRMALVGYNDNIWTDINENNQVDAGEMGAFKIVNSWGADYCNKGFAWIAYDALNEYSCVEGMSQTVKRASAIENVARVDVKPDNGFADAYINLTLNTADRSQMKVTVTAEKDGTVYSHNFLLGIGYLNDSNRMSFNGTTEACDGYFTYCLDNIVPDIDPMEVSHYTWDIKFTDTKDDNIPLTVKDVQVISEAENVVIKPAGTFPFEIDGSDKTVRLGESTLNNAVVYYIGYDSPTLHYKNGNSDWTQVKMTECIERIGHNYKYVIEDKDEEILLYFSDEQGNIDDNGGNFYKATDRLNYFRTTEGQGMHAPLEVQNLSFSNGIPDINKRTFFDTEITGGYEPYNYSYTLENLDTGEVKFYDYGECRDNGHYFRYGGNHIITVHVMDQAGDVSSFTLEYNVVDMPFIFSSFCATSDEKMFVGNEITFKADSDYEGVYSYAGNRNQYNFVIKDEAGTECYKTTKISDRYSFDHRNSTTTLNWTPAKAGRYSVTISSTDLSKTYAEKTLEFQVFDKIYGDANGDNVISIKDATAIQKKTAELYIADKFYEEMADCDVNYEVNIKDATEVQKYIASIFDESQVGKHIEYIPPVEPTEPETEPVTEPATTEPVTTEPTTASPVKNTVTFTNSLKWDGTIYCYYWSDTSSNMTSWPGQAMIYSETNGYNEQMYTFDVPKDATYIIFSNGQAQTTDIPYPGGEIRYYPLQTTDSKGAHQVNTW